MGFWGGGGAVAAAAAGDDDDDDGDGKAGYGGHFRLFTLLPPAHAKLPAGPLMRTEQQTGAPHEIRHSDFSQSLEGDW